MALFGKKNKIKNNEEIKKKVLVEYIDSCLQSGKTMEWAEQSLEENKEAGNYTSEDIAAAIIQVKMKEEKIKKPNFFVENKGIDINKEIKKLPRRERKMALKLWNDYQEGKILKIEPLKEVKEGE